MLFETLCIPWEGIPLVLTVIKQELKFQKNPTTLPLSKFGILPKHTVYSQVLLFSFAFQSMSFDTLCQC